MIQVPMRRARLSAAVSMALCVAQAVPAATIQVDNSGGCDLGEAIIAANDNAAFGGCSAGSGDDTILLPATAHFPTLPLPMITSNMTIIGSPIGTSAVNCEGGGQPFVIGDNDATPPTVTLSRFGVSFCGFQAGSGQQGGGGAAGMGGAVFVYNGMVTIDRVVFGNNSVRGGNGSTGTTTQSGGGGGMHGAGGVAATSSVAAFGFGSGGGGGGTAAVMGAVPGGAAGAPNGGSGGTGGIAANPAGNGGFGGGGGGGASLTGSQGGQNGGAGGFAGGGGSGGATSTTAAASTSAGKGGVGGFGGGGGAGGPASISIGGDGGAGGFGAGGGGRGFSESGMATPVAGKSGFGAQLASGQTGGAGAALGGAVFVRAGSVLVNSSAFNGNSALNAAGARLGGAVFVIDQAALDSHMTSGGSDQGLPEGELASVSGCGNSFSGNIGDVGAEHVYGADVAELTTPCKDVFKDGFE